MFSKKSKRQEPARRRQDSRPAEPASDVKNFRLGRTLTGSRSARIASGNELNAEMVSPRAKVHHLVHHRRRIFGRLLMVSALCVGLYLLMGQLVATIHVRATTDTDAVLLTETQMNTYQVTADNYFSRRINERFRPNLNTADLTSFMQASHPEIESVDMRLTDGFGAAQLELHMRRPVARWVVDGKTEFVNQDGIVFGQNFYADPRVKIIDKSAAELNGGLVASNRFLSFVGQVVGDLEERGLRVTKATIPTLTTRQLEISVKGVRYYFKLTIDRSVGEQAEDVARIARYFKKRENKPTYVDVRVKGKAFYK